MKTRDVHLYKKLHEETANYGDSGGIYVEEIAEFIQECNATSVLDFGCGKGVLADILTERLSAVSIDKYDPAIEGHTSIPQEEYSVIVSTDVLEHLYPDEIEGIFKEMLELNPQAMYHVISHVIANQILSDGSNAHKTVEPPEWWKEKIEQLCPEYTVSFTKTDVGHFKIIREAL